MNVILEQFDPPKHDKDAVAELIYDADPKMNSLVYGDRDTGIDIIKILMDLDNTYFSPPYLKCAMHEGELIGVITGFKVGEKSKIDAASGKAFAKGMGIWPFIKKLPLFFKLSKVTAGDMNKDGYYIHTLSIDPFYRERV
ncbi:MAG: hypothetical protein R6U17_00110 [Thermoplasmata archaeon]